MVSTIPPKHDDVTGKWHSPAARPLSNWEQFATPIGRTWWKAIALPGWQTRRSAIQAALLEITRSAVRWI
jgi:hypothetical protein